MNETDKVEVILAYGKNRIVLDLISEVVTLTYLWDENENQAIYVLRQRTLNKFPFYAPPSATHQDAIEAAQKHPEILTIVAEYLTWLHTQPDDMLPWFMLRQDVATFVNQSSPTLTPQE